MGSRENSTQRHHEQVAQTNRENIFKASRTERHVVHRRSEVMGHSPVSSWEKARVSVNTLKIREEKCLLSVANSVKLSIETEEEAGQLVAAVP